MGLVFGLIEAPPAFAEMRFELVYQALELVGSRVLGAASVREVAASVADAWQMAVGDVDAFLRTNNGLRNTLWDRDPPMGFELYYRTEALSWLLRLALAAKVGVAVLDLQKSRQFQQNAEHIRSRLKEAEPTSTRQSPERRRRPKSRTA